MKFDRTNRATPEPPDLEAQVRAYETALGNTKAELETARALVAERSTELVSAQRRVKELEAVHGPAPRPAEEERADTEQLAAKLDALGFSLTAARWPAREVSVTAVPGRFTAHGLGVAVTAGSPESLLDRAAAKGAKAGRRQPEPVTVAAPHVDRPYPDSEAAPVTAEASENGPRVLRGSVASGPEGMSR